MKRAPLVSPEELHHRLVATIPRADAFQTRSVMHDSLMSESAVGQMILVMLAVAHPVRRWMLHQPLPPRRKLD